jgi:colanic acid/amylovoran biosynthesis protein
MTRSHTSRLPGVRPARVLYSGTVVSNGGDSAILVAQLQLINRAAPGHSAVIHDAAPDVAGMAFPEADVLGATAQAVWSPPGPRQLARAARKLSRSRIRLCARLLAKGHLPRRLVMQALTSAERRALESLESADLVVYTGGTSLVEQYNLDPKLFELEIAQLLERPIILLPQSLGPFRDPRNRRRVRAVVANAACVLLRDQLSLDHLEEIGAATSSCHVVPDVVFSLATDESLRRLRDGRMCGPPRIGVSVRDCTRFFDGSAAERADLEQRYERAVADLATHVVSTLGATVVFLSTCQGLPGYWTDDSEIALRVADQMDPVARSRVVVDRAHRTTDQLIREFGAMDIVVSTRLHGAILALAAGTPVLPIAYEFKTHQVMAQLGLTEFVSDIREGTGESLRNRCDALFSALPELRGPLASRLAAVVQESHRTSDHVASVLGAHAGLQ